MTASKPINLWTSNEHARDYLERADSITHRSEGESALLEFIPESAPRILDLGTGDGRLLALVRKEHPNTEAVAVDFSPTMPLWASSMPSSPASRFIIWCTNASGRSTPRSTIC
jgi:spermidine synthase